jgi:3-hydroxybutyryl-CoA dehydrogenase
MNTKIPIGTVGLGLMGSSIATCILAAGHTITSLVKTMDETEAARKRIAGFLEELKEAADHYG